MADTPQWRDVAASTNYVKSIRRIYQSSPSLKITIQLLMSVFATAFFVFFAIRPTLTTITTLIKKIDDQNEANTKLDEKIVQLNEAAADLTVYEADLPLIDQAIPVSPELNEFVRKVEVVALETGVDLTNLQFQKIPLIGNKTNLVNDKSTKEEAGAAKSANLFVTFSFSAYGDEKTIVDFLSALENMDRALTITKLTLQKPPLQQQRFYSLSAAGRASIYYMEEKKTEVTPDEQQ